MTTTVDAKLSAADHPDFKRRRRATTKPYQNPALNIAFIKAKNTLGSRLFSVLLKTDVRTKCGLKVLIHDLGNRSETQKQQIEVARFVLDAVAEVRVKRKSFRTNRGARLFSPAEPWVITRYSLPVGTPRERLIAKHQKREQDLLNGVKRRFIAALNASRISHAEVRRAPAGAAWEAATASASSELGGQYSSRCTFRMTEAHLEVTIPANYEVVLEEGLAEIDGLLTLAVQSIPGQANEKVWKARWARKARGFSFVVEDGFIVSRNDEIAHGSTVSAARATLSRRETAKKLAAREERIFQRLLNNEVAGFEAVLVTAADSHKAGNCEEGTQAFIDEYFPDRTSATIAEVLEASRTSGSRRLAIAACLIALRRQAVT